MNAPPRPTPIDPAPPKSAEEPTVLPDRGGWLGELNRLDLAVYAAVAATPTPTLDRVFRRLSRAADHSKLWLASAAVLAVVGGARGRRAAIDGLASIAVTSTVVNAAQAARPPAPASPRHTPRPDHPPRDDASYTLVPVRPGDLRVGLRHRRGHCVARGRDPARRCGNARRVFPRPHRGPLPGRCDSRRRRRYDTGAAHRCRACAPPRPTAQELKATGCNDPPPRRPSTHGTLWS